ncbi:hypothetical protein SRHO_G00030930 [Serrasalmus rhombeus]
MNNTKANNSTVLNSIPEQDRAEGFQDLDLEVDDLPIERALGVQWCSESDQYRFKINLKERPHTRRGLFSIVSSIFDPLGFLSPIVLPAKGILQDLCRQKYSWDENLPDNVVKDWNKWISSLQQLADFGVDRCIKPKQFGEPVFAQLHHFADASANAYGTASYLLLRNATGEAHSTLVMAKARVTPLKAPTIPRMELTAATVAVKMDRLLKKELELELHTSVFWTDSTTVLKYLRSEGTRFKTFVANRISTILQHSQISQWRYVSSTINPADHVSRGQTVEAFLKNESWLSGPSFLRCTQEQWPKNPDPGMLDVDDLEIRRSAQVHVIQSQETENGMNRLMTNYSSWTKLKRAVAWFLRLKDLLKEMKERTHAGRNHMLAQLTQRFWIPGANGTIRRFLSTCVTCKRLHGTAGKQLMADLPKCRVLPDDPPFTRVGVDYFGPFLVKRGRGQEKRYGVIFTCLAIRAVHLEVASSLDTDACLNAIRRFVARRGQVREMYCDNGTNFRSADIELKKSIKEWNTNKITKHLQRKDIQWHFNPPAGSHHGGSWERLIRSVRKVLNITAREQLLTDEGLHTLLCEAEAIINSRPITKASPDLNDLEALTPNHLLLLKKKPELPPGVFNKDDNYANRRWKQIQYLTNVFWKRWCKEYLTQLQERQRWSTPARNFCVGDVVLIVDDTSPRNSWPLGRIVETFPDKKGFVRQVRIKTKTNELRRPVTKLCLLQESDND